MCEAEKQAQAGHGAGKVARCSCCGATKAIPFILLWSSTTQHPSSKRAAGSAPMHRVGCTLQIIPWRKAEKGQLTPHRGAVGCCNVTQELQGSSEQSVVGRWQRHILGHRIPAAPFCVGQHRVHVVRTKCSFFLKNKIHMSFLVRKAPPPQQAPLPCFHLLLTGYEDPSQQLTEHKHSHNFCPEPPSRFAQRPWVVSWGRQAGEKQVPKVRGESSHRPSRSCNNISHVNQSCWWLGASMCILSPAHPLPGLPSALGMASPRSPQHHQPRPSSETPS